MALGSYTFLEKNMVKNLLSGMHGAHGSSFLSMAVIRID